MKNLVNTTSVIGLVVALAMPAPLVAQSNNLQVCGKTQDVRSYPCVLKNGQRIESEFELLQARLARQEKALAQAMATQQIARGDQIDDEKDVAAEEALSKVKAQIAQTQELIQKEQARMAEAPAPAKDKPAVQEEPKVAVDKPAVQEQPKPEVTAKKRKNKKKKKAAAAAAAAAEKSGEVAKVESEQLEERDVRRSDQEFDTAVAPSGTEAVPADNDKGGLSNFEKALLLGLGAVVVGKVLDNGDEVVSRSGDRVVVKRDGELRVLKDDNALLRQPGNDLKTETFNDGSTRTTVTKPNGDRVVTVRASDGTVLRRVLFTAGGEEYTLLDDTQDATSVDLATLPQAPVRMQSATESINSEEALRAALSAQQDMNLGRTFSLRQIREIKQVRALAPEVELDAVRFATGSAAIQPEQARSLARIGNELRRIIAADPTTVFLVEGHTDAVGDASYNLALSDRRAETVALALTEYFGVPAENLITQGYGESDLKVPTLSAEPANRRAVVRNITPLLR